MTGVSDVDLGRALARLEVVITRVEAGEKSIQSAAQQREAAESALRRDMAALSTRIEELEGRFKAGRWLIVGLVLGAGMAVKGVIEFASDILGVVR